MTFTISQSSIPAHPSDFACIDLVNSSFTDYRGGGEAIDRLGSKQWQRWFLNRYGISPDAATDKPPLEELAVLRQDLRRILERWTIHGQFTRRDAKQLDARTQLVQLRQRVDLVSGDLELREEPLRRDWPWVMASLAISAVELIATQDFRRLKSCANPNCSWMFYDETINRSKQYCSTSPCGSLIRVRRFRHPR